MLNNQGDLIIISTLDLKIQETIEMAVQNNLKNLDKQIQVAVAVMDYNGAVKGLLGGRSWIESKYNRATQSKRQIGSVFKAYVYLTALSMGYSLSDKIIDLPIREVTGVLKTFLINTKDKLLLKEHSQFPLMLQR